MPTPLPRGTTVGRPSISKIAPTTKVNSDWRGALFVTRFKRTAESRMEETLKLCVNEAKNIEPPRKRTGELHDSIRYGEPFWEGPILWGQYGTDLDYGLYQEVGFHHYQDGFVRNPFLAPAFMNNIPKIAAIWARPWIL